MMWDRLLRPYKAACIVWSRGCRRRKEWRNNILVNDNIILHPTTHTFRLVPA
jgi:hypothetical protein